MRKCYIYLLSAYNSIFISLLEHSYTSNKTGHLQTQPIRSSTAVFNLAILK